MNQIHAVSGGAMSSIEFSCKKLTVQVTFYNSTDHVAKVYATMMAADCLYDELNVGEYCGDARVGTQACRLPEVNLFTFERMFSWNVVRYA